MVVKNKDHHSADYTDIASYYRPGHADFTFDEKYGLEITEAVAVLQEEKLSVE